MKKLLLIGCFIGLIEVGAFAQTKPTATEQEKKAKELQKELKLNDVQTGKVAAIYAESAQKFEKIKTADHGNTNKMLVDIKPLRAATVTKIKAVLTPAQSAKYAALVKNSKVANGGNGWSDGWAATETDN